MLYALLVISLLDMELQDKLFNYFVENVTSTGKVLDRESNRQIVSVAATGFGMYVWAVGSTEGNISRAEAINKVRKAFRNTLGANPDKNRGFLFHFTNEDGKPIAGTEVSTIDTTIFYLGAQQAALLLKDEDLIKEVQSKINEVDIKWLMMGEYVRHGLYWDGEEAVFIDVLWDNYSEGIMIYKLFDLPYNPTIIRHDLSLFAYYYPLCFYDDASIKENLRKAIVFQQEKYGYWGITALDTEYGYQDFHPDNISPLTILTLSNYLSLDIKSDVPNSICQSRNRLTNWTSADRIGIDDGAAYILLWKAKQ